MAAIDKKLERCDPADPHRCQAMVATGQCPYLAEEGKQNCAMHLGMGKYTEKEKEIRNYRLAKWQARVNEFADNEKVKSLREEIGIARMMLEEIIGRCQDSSDLVLFTPRISEMITRIEKLVVSCHRLEEKTGMLMDKSGAIHLAGTIVDIVGKYVTEPSVLELIGNQIAEAICGIKMETGDESPEASS